MKIYVYAPNRGADANTIARHIGAERLGRFDGIDFWSKNSRITLEPGSVIVCWGGAVGEIPGVRVINSTTDHFSRYRQLNNLANFGLNIPQLILPDANHGIEEFVKAGYLPRLNGKTMLHIYTDVPSRADYYAAKQVVSQEYRVHFLQGVVVAAGEQVPRKGFGPGKKWTPTGTICHSFVRTYEAGWETRYEVGLQISSPTYLDAAIKASGLDFGAITVVKTADNRWVFLKVDSAPYLDETVTPLYLASIRKLIYEPEAIKL